MSRAPKVSICVPAYNGQRYLVECLASALAQTEADHELLIVDDGSSDATLEIAHGFAARDARVRVLRNERNLGLVANWNRCVAEARGEWIKFLFQDDLIAPRCLQEMLAAAARSGCPAVFCSRDFVFDDEIPAATVAHYRGLPTLASVCGGRSELEPEAVVAAFFDGARSSNFFGEPTCALLHRSLFERFGGFNTDLIQFCDLEYWLRVCSNVGMAWVAEPLASFRVHGDSTSQRNAARKAFRSTTLDRLVLLHQFAYAPEYRALRRAARRLVRPPVFQRKLAKDAFWAASHARAAPAGSGLLDDWNEVARHYPRLGRSFWQLPLQGKAWLNRHLLWRVS